jgi:hypothetical protein
MPKQPVEELYTIADHTVYNPCCDSIQFKYTCITCGENAGCYFCTFDPELPHECKHE